MFNRICNVPDRIRLLVMGAMTVVILATINAQIAGKERIVREGTTVLLRIAPRDPRSLVQGDYMALRYAMAREVAKAANAAGVSDGRVVIGLQDSGEAEFVAMYNGQSLSEKQHVLKFRKRGESVRLASDAFFFEEGQWRLYSGAGFGELRVDNDGDAVLTGLRDRDGKRLGAPLH